MLMILYSEKGDNKRALKRKHVDQQTVGISRVLSASIPNKHPVLQLDLLISNDFKKFTMLFYSLRRRSKHLAKLLGC